MIDGEYATGFVSASQSQISHFRDLIDGVGGNGECRWHFLLQAASQ